MDLPVPDPLIAAMGNIKPQMPSFPFQQQASAAQPQAPAPGPLLLQPQGGQLPQAAPMPAGAPPAPQAQQPPAPNVVWTQPGQKLTAPPQPGDIVNGTKYLGGNPAKQGSWQPLTGQDYFNTLPPDRQRFVEGIVNAKLPMPQGFVMKDPYWKQIGADVVSVDPSMAGEDGGYDQKQFAARQKLLNSFTSGPDSKTIAALRLGTQHAAGMQQAYDNLGNFNTYPMVNDAINTVENGFNPKVQSGLSALNLNRDALAGETASVFANGGQPSVTETEGYKKDFDPNAGPNASDAALGKIAQLYNSRLNTLQQKWKDGMGPLAKPYPIIDQHTQQAWSQLTSRYDPDTGELRPPMPAQAAPQGQKPLSPQDAAKLPPGTPFIGTDGVPRVRH